MKRFNKRGQIWVETVIYTLIGLAIIGLVLSTALPKINAKKDEVLIEQSIEALRIIDDKIYEIQRAVGNKRIVNLDIGKGSLIIDSDEDEISWILDSSFEYSESGIPISIGRINVTTTPGSPWKVELKVGYNVDIIYNNKTDLKQLDSAPTPYNLMIEYPGKSEEGNIVINLFEA